jgi:hypothetical protein
VTNVRNSDSRENRQTMISESEFQKALDQANQVKNKFLRLRALAVLSLFRLTGKRRGELAVLPLENFKIEDKSLNVTFILEKKRQDKVLQKLATKSRILAGPLTQNILAYLEYLNKLEPKPKFWLPRAWLSFWHWIHCSSFSQRVIIIDERRSNENLLLSGFWSDNN